MPCVRPSTCANTAAGKHEAKVALIEKEVRDDEIQGRDDHHQGDLHQPSLPREQQLGECGIVERSPDRSAMRRRRTVPARSASSTGWMPCTVRLSPG